MIDSKIFIDTNILVYAKINECSILYSEDMHHEQLIVNSLQIINPLKLK